ncbi:Acetyltransferase, GNAT [Bacillus cereus R309803]|nr:Acetyltransferase, GNAT [Bacillus cereus R309803]
MREALHIEQVEEWLQDCFEFVELAVHPKYQKEGLGTKLHNRLLNGISNRTSVLTTQISNVKARSLYERLDWVNILDPFYPALMGSKTPISKFSESKEFRWGINCP